MPDTGASRKRQIRGNRIRGHFIAPDDSAAGNRRSHDSLQFNWSRDPDCQGGNGAAQSVPLHPRFFAAFAGSAGGQDSPSR
jgi:hypothetical protein